MKSKYILGIETSCDETSIAIVKNGTEPVCEFTASQVKLMAKYGGVVPELSARKHLEALPILLKECKAQNPNEYKKVELIAVSHDPGLPPALAAGMAFAKGLGFGRNLPVIFVDHLHGHLISSLVEDPPIDNPPQNYQKRIEFPNICLLVSGGHTGLYLVNSPSDYKLLGQTKDDAAGEAFDKVARMLGLGYPGGPIIQKWAEKAKNIGENPFSIPIQDKPYSFSFSGLKTAVRRYIVGLSAKSIEKLPKDIEIEKLGTALPEKAKAEISYWFQETVVESLVRKTIEAAKKNNIGLVTLTGGVAANKRLREKLAKETIKINVKVKYPQFKRCTDNATMVAAAGYFT